MVSKVILSLVLLQAIQLVFGAPRSENFACNLEVDSETTPLISNKDGNLQPYKRSDGKWFVKISHGEYFTASCPSKNARSQFVNFENEFLNLECVSGSLVKANFGFTNFTDLKCQRTFAGTVVRTGTCYNGYTEAEIRVSGGTDPTVPLITVCHNEELDETLYAKSYIYGAKMDEMESGGNRPSFVEGGFYPNISTDDCYKQVTQIETVGILVGSQSLADEYIQTGKNLFFSRGHLTPNGDPILQVEKHSTFYFINASPQWQTINGGNWNRLEQAVRDIAGNRQSTLTVWTGNHEVLELDDVNGNPVEIWLGRDSKDELIKKLPVPKYLWKVIYDESKNEGVAVIQVNNPWDEVTSEDVFCPDLCSELNWIVWNTEDIRLGYTFCCDVAAFQMAVPFAPSLANVSLLE